MFIPKGFLLCACVSIDVLVDRIQGCVISADLYRIISFCDVIVVRVTERSRWALAVLWWRTCKRRVFTGRVAKVMHSQAFVCSTVGLYLGREVGKLEPPMHPTGMHSCFYKNVPPLWDLRKKHGEVDDLEGRDGEGPIFFHFHAVFVKKIFAK